tara:strand:- start:854 stop:1024 length:171 start_codon:yes stop_codon:yes gene_type:complete
MENLKVSDQPQIILKRLIKLNKLMLEEASRMGRPHLTQHLETQKALMEMLQPYLDP